MKTIRRAQDRGAANHGWLDARHTFSFANYHDPEHMQYRSLRVMNEDRIAPGKGFGMHPHENMEILTYVIEGALQHKDSMGNGSVIHAGELQKMSAGTGVTHSEFNPSETEPTHLYQVWIIPSVADIEPSYHERVASDGFEEDAWNLIAAPDAEGSTFPIAQDARVYLGKLNSGTTLEYGPDAERHVWIQVVKGSVTVADESLDAGDGIAIEQEEHVTLVANEHTDVMLFDLV